MVQWFRSHSFGVAHSVSFDFLYLFKNGVISNIAACSMTFGVGFDGSSSLVIKSTASINFGELQKPL